MAGAVLTSTARRSLVLAGLAVVMLVIAGSAGADQSYTDPTGDAGVGSDIVALTVRNDTAGNISIQIGLANPIVSNHAIGIFIDADHNPSTGSSTGDEYLMYGGPATGVVFGAWNGSQFALRTPASFSVGTAASHVMEFRINRGDLGNTSAFNFVAVSVSDDPPDPNLHFWDYAPNSGSYSYTLATPTPPPTTTSTPTPKPPKQPPPPAPAKPKSSFHNEFLSRR